MAKHNEPGHQGELFAAQYLESINYQIIETDWQYNHKDIDIIALDENQTLVFIEVKTRRNDLFGSPADAIDQQKMQNLIRCANTFIRMHKYNGNSRFDVISLIGTQPPFALTHIKDAFNAATAFG